MILVTVPFLRRTTRLVAGIYIHMQDKRWQMRQKYSLEDILDACVDVADVQAMECQCKESSQVCKGAQPMQLSECLVQLLHLIRDLQDVQVVE